MCRPLMFLFLLCVCGASYGTEIPEGATAIYRGNGDVPGYSVVFFRAADGAYWRRLARIGDGEVENETRYGSLGGLRTALLAIDDHQGIMGSALWNVDSDGDGFSDMLEYLTNGDPHYPSTYPTEPRILYFDGGQSFEALLPVQDMRSGSPNEIGGDNLALEQHAITVVALMSFLVGLMLWRLTILAVSRRNIL